MEYRAGNASSSWRRTEARASMLGGVWGIRWLLAMILGACLVIGAGLVLAAIL